MLANCITCDSPYDLTTKVPMIILNCGHNICNSCLKKKNQIKTNIPVCDKDNILITAYTKDYGKISKLNEYINAETTQEEKICEFCDDKHPANYYCQDCTQYMCSATFQTHSKMKLTKQHQTKKIDNPISTHLPFAIKPKECPFHNEPFEMCCKEDDYFFCPQCPVVNHRTHEMEPINAIYANEQERFRIFAKKSNDKLNNIPRLVDTIEKDKSIFEHNAIMIDYQIDEYFNNLIKIIEERRTHLKLENEKLKNAENKQLNKQLNSIEEYKKGIIFSNDLCNRLIKSNETTSFISNFGEMEKYFVYTNKKITDTYNNNKSKLLFVEFNNEINDAINQIGVFKQREEMYCEKNFLATIQFITQKANDKEITNNDLCHNADKCKCSKINKTSMQNLLEERKIQINHMIEEFDLINGWYLTHYSYLHKASLLNLKEIVHILVSNGIDINAKNNYGGTALQLASSSGNLDVVQYLIQHGATIEAADNDGFTSLHSASFEGHLNVVQLLIDNGANVNAFNNNHDTCLHFASLNGHTTVVEYLINHQADVNAFNHNNQTPYDIVCNGSTANKHNKLHIQHLLKKI